MKGEDGENLFRKFYPFSLFLFDTTTIGPYSRLVPLNLLARCSLSELGDADLDKRCRCFLGARKGAGEEDDDAAEFDALGIQGRLGGRSPLS